MLRHFEQPLRYVRLLRAGIVILLSGSIAACQAQPIKVKIDRASKATDIAEFRLVGLPKSVRATSADLNYQVQNRDCVPVDYARAWGGVRLLPQHSLPATIATGADGTMSVAIRKDALLDEDYYALGTCHWAFDSLTFVFASPRGRHFVAALSARDLDAGRPIVLRYLVSDYMSAGDGEAAIFGETPGFYPDNKPQFALDIVVRRAKSGDYARR